MVTFIFNDVKELADWRKDYIKKFNEVPRITAKIVDGEHLFTASVSL